MMRKASVEALLGELNAAGVRYLVAGGLAVTAHGYLRTTVDVDVILDLERANLERALAAFARLGYRPKAPVALQDFLDSQKRQEWIDTKGLTVFSLHSPDHPATDVDIFVKDPIGFERAYACAHRVPISESVTATFVGFDDLREMKRRAGRPQDILDIEQLEGIRNQHGKS